MNIYLYNYNNYYNRMVKVEDSLEDYGSPLSIQQSFNFNPNDGVSTTCVFNYDGSNGDPDYALVLDDQLAIVSRWFVIEAQRTRLGQYQVTLFRDVIADHLDSIKTSPAFIEKATLDDEDPAIFNSENMTYNQIKTSETELRDVSNCAWIIGYLAKGETISGTVANNNIEDEVFENIGTTLENWEYYKVDGVLRGNVSSSSTVVRLGKNINTSVNLNTLQSYYDKDGNYNTKFPSQAIGSGTTGVWINFNLATPSDFEVAFRDEINWNSLQSLIVTSLYQPDGDDEDILQYNGKIIKTSDGKYYRITVNAANNIKDITNITNLNYATIWSTLATGLNSLVSEKRYLNGSANEHTFYTEITYNGFQLSYDEVTNMETTYDIPTASKIITTDAPYDIFAIPYGGGTVAYKQDGFDAYLGLNKEIALDTAMAIIKQHTGASAKVYDMQILPYCPFNLSKVKIYGVNSGVYIDIKNATSGKEYNFITHNDEPVGIIINSNRSSFTVDIPVVLNSNDSIKVQSECDFYRLVSPNFNGQFEFNAAKNGGVTRFNVDCTYKPFSPYIHVNPDFGRLYGRDFNDARGLICGGEFGLPMISDAWETYQRQNVNYQNIFDREVQNLEINQKYQRMGELISTPINAVSGGVSGGVMGSLGGPVGMAAGAAVGAAASLAGGIADIAINDQLRNETLDLKRDMFGYQMGNIQALPASLSRTTAFTFNNKIFPILEYYTCTAEEKQALEDKLKYNGMTVMRIGKIEDYIKPEPTYIKAKLIRLEDLGEDYHMANTIANEIDKGVYM